MPEETGTRGELDEAKFSERELSDKLDYSVHRLEEIRKDIYILISRVEMLLNRVPSNVASRVTAEEVEMKPLVETGDDSKYFDFANV